MSFEHKSRGVSQKGRERQILLCCTHLVEHDVETDLSIDLFSLCGTTADNLNL